MWYLNTVSLKNILHSHYFSLLNVTFPSTLQLLLMLRGTGLIMPSGLGKLTVWYTVMNVLDENSKCIFTGSQKMPRPKPLHPPFRLHGPITQQTTILNLNILHLSCEVSLLCFVTKELNTCITQ
jgi:hypothetical protein